MNERKAGERKRTVTIVIGPQTEAFLTELLGEMNSKLGGQVLDMTGLAGLLFDRGLHATCVTWATSVPATYGCHYQ